MKKIILPLSVVIVTCLLSACQGNSDYLEVSPIIPTESNNEAISTSQISEPPIEDTKQDIEQTEETSDAFETATTKESIEETSPSMPTGQDVISSTSIQSESTSSTSGIEKPETAVSTNSTSTTTAKPVETTATTAATTGSTTAVQNQDPVEVYKPKILVAYFSTPEITDATTTPSRVTVNGEIYGTTEYMAMVIHQNTDSDLFRIELEEPYGDDVPDRALNEQENGVLPALSSHIDNPEQYDIIFVGYPTWWYDMPQVMYSFFNEYDFSGKKIIPFNSHGGSQFSGSVERIAELEPNADVSNDGLTLSRKNVDSSEDTIIQWLNQLDISER